MKTLLGLILLAFVIWAVAQSPDSTPAHLRTYPSPKPVELQPHLAMTIEKFDWRSGGFDTVAIGTFTIRNLNDFQVNDVALSCDLFAPSGTPLHTLNTTIYDTIGAKKTRTFRNVSLGFRHSQSASAACKIIGARR